MSTHTVPTFTADDIRLGTIIDSEEAVKALPDNAVIVLARDDYGFVSEDIYKSFGSQFINMDPTDRDDGERSYSAEDMWAIANKRDFAQIIHVWSESIVGVPIESLEQLEKVGYRSIVIETSDPAIYGSETRETIFFNLGGSWTEYNPADRYDGEDSYLNSDLWNMKRGGALHHVWAHPESKTE